MQTITNNKATLRQLMEKSVHFFRKENGTLNTPTQATPSRNVEVDERYSNFIKFWEVNEEGLRELFFDLHDRRVAGDLMYTRLWTLTEDIGDRRPTEADTKGWGFLQWFMWLTYLSAPKAALDAIQDVWSTPLGADLTVNPMRPVLTRLLNSLTDPAHKETFTSLTFGNFEPVVAL